MLEPLNVLIGSVSAVELAVVAGAVLLAGFLRGFVGFGAALIIIMVLSVVFGPLVAVPVANLAGLPATFQLLPSAVRDAERFFVVPFCIGAFGAAPVGAWVLVAIKPSVMRLVISGFVFSMVGILYCGSRLMRCPAPVPRTGSGPM